MNSDIKSLLIRVCGTISYLIVIFFFVTFILFLHNDVKDALKEAWSVSVSFLSVLATLGAAIIAANLFNDWKSEHSANNKSEYAKEIANYLVSIKSLCDFHYELVFAFKDLEELRANKDLTKNYIDEMEYAASQLSAKSLEFNQEYNNLYKSFRLATLAYSNFFDTELLPDSDVFEFHTYAFSINTNLKVMYPNPSKCTSTINFMISRKKAFENKFYNPVFLVLKTIVDPTNE